MTKQFLPPLIEIKDPEVPPKDIRLLVRIEDELNYPGDFESFFIQSNHLSIVSHRIVKRKNKPNFLSTRQFKNKPNFLSTRQFDAPLSILPWFVNKFEFFTKMPH